MDLDDELGQMTVLPEDLQEACVNLLRIASKHKASFGGMLIRLDGELPFISCISNITHTSSQMAEIFRMYADLMEQKERETVTIDIPPTDPTVN